MLMTKDYNLLSGLIHDVLGYPPVEHAEQANVHIYGHPVGKIILDITLEKDILSRYGISARGDPGGLQTIDPTIAWHRKGYYTIFLNSALQYMGNNGGKKEQHRVGIDILPNLVQGMYNAETRMIMLDCQPLPSFVNGNTEDKKAWTLYWSHYYSYFDPTAEASGRTLELSTQSQHKEYVIPTGPLRSFSFPCFKHADERTLGRLFDELKR